MRTAFTRTVTRGLLWTSVVVFFILGSLLIASCQEKHELSRASEPVSSPSAEEKPPLSDRDSATMTDFPLVEEHQAPGEPVLETEEEEAAHEPSAEILAQEPAAPCRYEVEKGDNVWAISRRFYGTHVYWRLLAEANAIEDPADIRPGQTIEIPPLSEFPYRLYVVREGDNLTTISETFYETRDHWDRLAKANGLPSANRIYAGAVLKIPPLETAPMIPADSTLLASE